MHELLRRRTQLLRPFSIFQITRSGIGSRDHVALYVERACTPPRPPRITPHTLAHTHTHTRPYTKGVKTEKRAIISGIINAARRRCVPGRRLYIGGRRRSVRTLRWRNYVTAYDDPPPVFLLSARALRPRRDVGGIRP